MTDRRSFLRQATARATAIAALGQLPVAPIGPPQGEWDFGWTTRLAGTRRALFDVVDVESGFGLFRAAVWTAQCAELLHEPRANLSSVVVLRSHALVLALHQEFWDRYEVGALRRVTHPVTLKETRRNPALMTERDGLPPSLAQATLSAQLASGTTVLACNLALTAWVDALRARTGSSEADARKEVVGALVPGVILQPSGVLAAVLAQEHGCHYVRAG